jgi:hypothetical protein
VSLTPATLSGSAAMVTGLVAFAAVATDAGWQFIRHGTVMAHEGAHAVFVSLLFRRFDGIDLNADATGETHRKVTGGCLGEVVLFFVGYVGPSLFGLGAARLIQLGHSTAVLWVTLTLLSVLLLGLRRNYGIITVIFTGTLVYLVARYTPTGLQIAAAYVITWLLLLSGVRGILQRGPDSGDGANLKRLTGVPRLIWFLIWLAATLGAVAVGGKMLVMPT